MLLQYLFKDFVLWKLPEICNYNFMHFSEKAYLKKSCYNIVHI